VFKDTVSDKKKFWLYFFLLLFCGFMLFIFGVLIYPPFRDLALALNSKESVPLSIWFVSGTLALLLGSFWLCIYILFEAAKKGMVDLIHKK
jgi:hypothetical protein